MEERVKEGVVWICCEGVSMILICFRALSEFCEFESRALSRCGS